MTDKIQRYKASYLVDWMKKTPEVEHDSFIVFEEDHIKAIQAKDNTINKLWETLGLIADFLKIDIEESRSAKGKPSDVYIKAMEAKDKTIEAQAKEIHALKEASNLLADKCLNLEDSFAEKLSLTSFCHHIKELTK